ncbi:MAG: DMT family transporter [Anaerolineaceae bacterium]|nr:MAG: DMT family transporter [Anaerolineaceae bacterium]
MNTTSTLMLYGLGAIAGGMIAIQSLLNATLGQRLGNLGSVLVLTIISIIALAVLILVFPNTADLRKLPSFSEWYLYVGGVLGVAILAAPIFLVPRIGTSSTLVAIVLGQMVMALLIDHFGIFVSPKIEVTLTRVLGIALGAFLVGK